MHNTYVNKLSDFGFKFFITIKGGIFLWMYEKISFSLNHFAVRKVLK